MNLTLWVGAQVSHLLRDLWKGAQAKMEGFRVCRGAETIPHSPLDATTACISAWNRRDPLDWGLGVGRRSSRENSGNEKISRKNENTLENRCFRLSQIIQEKAF